VRAALILALALFARLRLSFPQIGPKRFGQPRLLVRVAHGPAINLPGSG
jgi:hypothetical protein